MRRTQHTTADFEGGGRGLQARECGWFLQTEKGKEMDSPESLQKGLYFHPVRLISDFCPPEL